MTASRWKSCSTTTFSLSLGTYTHMHRQRSLSLLMGRPTSQIDREVQLDCRDLDSHLQPCRSSCHLPEPTGPDPCRNTRMIIRDIRQTVRQSGGSAGRQVPVEGGDESPGAALLLQQPADSCCFTVLTRSEHHRLKHIHLKYNDGENGIQNGWKMDLCNFWLQIYYIKFLGFPGLIPSLSGRLYPSHTPEFEWQLSPQLKHTKLPRSSNRSSVRWDPAYLVLADCLVIIQKLKHCRGRVFLKGCKELWEKTGSRWKDKKLQRQRSVVSCRAPEWLWVHLFCSPASPGSSSFSSAELRLAMSSVKRLVFSNPRTGEV